MEETIQNYIDTNGITFRLQATNEDGEILLQETSTLSFDDVSSSSFILDEAFQKLVQEAEEGRDDDITDAEVKDARDY